MLFPNWCDLRRSFSVDCDIINIRFWFVIIISLGLSGIIIYLLFFGYFVSEVSLDWTNALGHCHRSDKLIIRYLLDLTLNFLCEIVLSFLDAYHFLLL